MRWTVTGSVAGVLEEVLMAVAGLTPVPAGEVIAAVRRAGRSNPLLGIEPADGAGSPTQVLTADQVPALVAAVGDRFAVGERRVAASLTVLGYAARLVGPAIAVLLRDGLVLDLRPDRVRYRFGPDTGFRLALSDPAGWHGDPAELSRLWSRIVIDEHLAALVGAVHDVVPVAVGLLWGNVASGLTGALRVLAGGAVPVGRCHRTGLELLGRGPLAGSGTLTLTGDGELRFVRTSCCLYYRLPGGGTCGDCPLAAENRSDRRADRRGDQRSGDLFTG